MITASPPPTLAALRGRLREGERALADKLGARIDVVEQLKPVAIGVAATGALLLASANLAVGWKPALIGALAFAGAIFGGLLDRRKLEVTTDARALARLADDALAASEVAAIEQDAAVAAISATSERLHSRIAAQRLMREVLEQGIEQRLAVDEIAASILDAASLSAAAAFAFAPGEEWTLSVFTIDAGSEPSRMVRIAAVWADRMAERSDGRSWVEGEGFTGVAWQRNSDVVEDDTRTPVAGPYPVHGDNFRGYDVDRYRSVASIPIRVGQTNRVWGVVTATSDAARRFQRQGVGADAQPVEAVRDIAGLLSLAAVIEDSSVDEPDA